MKFLKSLLMGTGGVVLAGLILALLAPRAVHAVVATAVQVVNTSASPAITQSIGNQAAQIVQIECGILPGSAIEFPGTSLNVGCVAVPPAGFNFDVPPPANSQYTVPAGETLVVTSVDILSGAAAGSPCTSSAFGELEITQTIGVSNRKSWIVPAGAGTVHYVYPSGILFPPGVSLFYFGNDNLLSSCTMTINMHGYLTAQ